MFVNDSTNRSIVKDIAESNNLILIDPEIFLRFVNDDFYIKSWDDVAREMEMKNGNIVSMSRLKSQYKLCGILLYSSGYTEFDRSKL